MSIKTEIDKAVDNIYLCGEHGRKDVSEGYKTGLAQLFANELEKLPRHSKLDAVSGKDIQALIDSLKGKE